MKPIIYILIACGSGMATSTIAAETGKQVAYEAGIRIHVIKGSIAEIQTLENTVDIILTTMKYNKPLAKPYLCVQGFVSGVGKEKTRKKLEVLLRETQNQS